MTNGGYESQGISAGKSRLFWGEGFGVGDGEQVSKVVIARYLFCGQSASQSVLCDKGTVEAVVLGVLCRKPAVKATIMACYAA